MNALYALVLAGCWTGNAPIPPPAHARFPVAGRELADPAIAGRLDHHAWIDRVDRAWLDPLVAIPLEPRERGPFEWSVLELRADAIRVLSDWDDVRIGVWLPRAAAVPVIISQVALSADGVHGAWLAPGVPIAVRDNGLTIVDADVSIATTDPNLEVSGKVSQLALGAMWIGPEPSVTGATPSNAMVDAATEVHIAANARSPIVARIGAQPQDAIVIASSGGWTEVGISRYGVRVRGYVPAMSVQVTNPTIRFRDTVGAGGYQLEDPDVIVLAAGTCLYDRVGGDVIGVVAKTGQRYVHGGPPAWPSIAVGTYWGLAWAFAHEVSPAKLESCALSDR